MVEAKNFVEKELGKSLDEEQNTEQSPEKKESIPVYTPPPPQPQEPVPPVPQFFVQQPPVVQVVEKIIYKKQRIHGFFRTLTIIALLVIGFLMLGESTGLITLSVNSFKLHQIFPLVIIFSTIIIWSYKGLFGKIFGLILFLTVFGGIFTIGIYTSLNPSTTWMLGKTIDYTIPKTNNEKTNIYLHTLIGKSDIKGTGNQNNIQGIRNSERHLLISSGADKTINYIKFNEDTNRNVLQNYFSNIDLTLPKNKIFNLIYIKNLLGIHTIDLTTFQWKTLKIHAGIDDITLRIGNILSGNKVEIQGTAANVTLDIPEDIGVMMYYKHMVGMIDAPGFDILSGHYFQSQNIDKAKDILNLYINLGIGNTKINRVSTK